MTQTIRPAPCPHCEYDLYDSLRADSVENCTYRISVGFRGGQLDLDYENSDCYDSKTTEYFCAECGNKVAETEKELERFFLAPVSTILHPSIKPNDK